MSSYNKSVLVGCLGKDPEVKSTSGGTSICELSLAVSRQWKDKGGNKQEATDWIPITCFGRTAEIAGEYLAKGRQVLVEGRLQLDSWEDKDTKEKRSKLKVICEHLVMLGSKGGHQSSEPKQDAPTTTVGMNSDDVPF